MILIDLFNEILEILFLNLKWDKNPVYLHLPAQEGPIYKYSHSLLHFQIHGVMVGWCDGAG